MEDTASTRRPSKWNSSSQNMAEEIEEGAHLVASVVKDVGAPVGVLSLPGVGILVGGGAVKVIEAELVPGEVGGDPVHDDADARLVQLVHEVHEVVGGAEAAGGGKVAGDTGSPRRRPGGAR